MLAPFKVPAIENEPLKIYAPGSPERAAVQAAIAQMERELPFEVPAIINGEPVKTGKLDKQVIPSDHARHICIYHETDESAIARAIEGALAAKAGWEAMPWSDRAAIFLKAADLISKKYWYKLMAATILGEGRTVWQAEIDAVTELADFFRFGVKYVEEFYSYQPPKNFGNSWNRVEYCPLEGFVLAVSSYNFTAIGGNIPGTPALVGNVVLWKPSPAAMYLNYIVHQILTEAGIPPGVIQFVPSPSPEVVAQLIAHREFAGVHFAGSTFAFEKLWKDITTNIDNYRNSPRIVGETAQKNFHLIHKSAEIRNAALQSARAAFEFQGQKCSALSRLYVSASAWNGGLEDLFLEEIAKMRVGPSQDFGNFMGPVIGRPIFHSTIGYILKGKEAGGQILIGGNADIWKGYYVEPTVILMEDPKSVTMRREIFGPVLTVYVYDDADFDQTLDLINTTSEHAHTGTVFASERQALIQATNKLHRAAGNVYYNDKCTVAVVGQQPFGGGRASGTNDRGGGIATFYRFVSMRSIKENFGGGSLSVKLGLKWKKEGE